MNNKERLEQIIRKIAREHKARSFTTEGPSIAKELADYFCRRLSEQTPEPNRADAERYKRERDEAVGLLRDVEHEIACGIRILKYPGNDWQSSLEKLRDGMRTFLARIEQGDWEVKT